MDQNTARTLAREVGTRAKKLGVDAEQADNPSVSQLAEMCAERGVDLHDVLACC